MRVMSAGDGYKYLLRTVAAGDGKRSPSTPLTRYYNAVRTRRGMRWGMLAWPTLPIYCFIGTHLTGYLAAGGLGWLNLVVLVIVWDIIKMFLLGPFSVMWLTGACFREFRARRAMRPVVMRAA